MKVARTILKYILAQEMVVQLKYSLISLIKLYKLLHFPTRKKHNMLDFESSFCFMKMPKVWVSSI